MPHYPLYDIAAIKEILPHRNSFLFVDRIVKLEAGEKIIAEKDLSIDESFFTGHFPGNPIMPGVLISEALAQTSGLLLGLTWKDRGKSLDREKVHLVLATIDMKFSHPAKPGETLRLESSLKKKYGKLFLFEAAAYVVNKQIAKGTLALAEEK
jgi:beta-hydroxyacyl-ACP dehydratase FabZ